MTTILHSLVTTERTLTRPDGVEVTLCRIKETTHAPAYKPQGALPRTKPIAVDFHKEYDAWMDSYFICEPLIAALVAAGRIS